MSRRTPNPAAERAAQNAQTIKSLLKLEGNKICADCKRNKHPRWASWNLGIFICIRCSGIHRGMGTHISRVKSVDLDAWTNEQLESVLKWGNSRANKYWESKLAAGHVPSDSKIENFIRTKYETKRWVMEGPIPDPSALEADEDEDVPLRLIKEKQDIERSTLQAAGPPQNRGASQIKRAQQSDLLEKDVNQPLEANITHQKPIGTPPKPNPIPKQIKPADSLLGLEFFGSDSPPTARPSSAVQTPGTQSRPDLKQSILSLYATVPRAQLSPNPAAMATPLHSPAQRTSFGAMSDAFGSLSFAPQKSPAMATTTATNISAKASQKTSAFSSLGNIPNQNTSSHASASTFNGGNFFNVNPVVESTTKPSSDFSSISNFSAFDTGPISPPANQASKTMDLSIGEVLSFTSQTPQTSTPSTAISSPLPQQKSVFNLSQTSPRKNNQSSITNSTVWSTSDAWASSDTWGSASKPSPKEQIGSTLSSTDGWGSSGDVNTIHEGVGNNQNRGKAPPAISSDEEFGGWSSATLAAPMSNALPPKPAASFAVSDDLFSNVWG
ncbi:stromal membrane-associated protein [Blumeria hordei DH14]|uniref:Stromal membrane-associated protein n=1 Tax=Blumeria graminis f. sp. hordei (strain DH14) TaxID=546991 RepID=N1JR24_BLUG1|nr:stromal membrane-associated protein [Blumeria hordei DH14]